VIDDEEQNCPDDGDHQTIDVQTLASARRDRCAVVSTDHHFDAPV
jgi:hypothetical protein